jgi:lipopolysaccharide transport system permease protein
VSDGTYWNLLRVVSVSQYKLKDQNTFFGFLWSFLHPLLVLVILYEFFNARVGQNIPNYGLYLLIAIIHFTHFSNSTTGAMLSLYNLRQLTCNTILPKEVLVIGAVLSKLPEFAISMLIGVAIAWFAGVHSGWSIVALPAIFLIQVLLVLWVSLALSAIYVFVKDIIYVYQAFLRVLFLITPTFYGADFVGHGAARYVVLFNPLAQLIGFSRAAILGGGVSLFVLGALIVANIALIWVALAFFRRLEPKFAEYV